MKERLERLLQGGGYEKLATNVEGLVLYYGCTMSMVYAVQVFDCDRMSPLTNEQLSNVRRQIALLFEQRGFKDIHIFTLLLTGNTEELWPVAAREADCWMVDMQQKRLVISERQPADFYGLKRIVETALSDTDIPLPEPEPTAGARAGRRQQDDWESRKGFISRNYSTTNFIIIIINIVAFIMLELGGSTEDVYYMLDKGALFYASVIEDGEYYRLLTSMFMHYGVMHLFGNMLVLFFLGDNVDRAVGAVKYLIIYLGSGLLSGAASMWLAYLADRPFVSAGASGAIFGLVGAIVWILIRNKGRLEDISLFRMGLFICYSLYAGATSPGVDNVAHVAGLLTGIVLSVLLYRKPEKGGAS